MRRGVVLPQECAYAAHCDDWHGNACIFSVQENKREQGNVMAVRKDLMHTHTFEMAIQEKHYWMGMFTTCRGEPKSWR